MQSFALPARLEGAALGPLRDALLSLRGADLDLDGGAVERLNGLGLQLLLSARRTWGQDGRHLRVVQPSAPLSEAFQRAAVADLLQGASVS